MTEAIDNQRHMKDFILEILLTHCGTPTKDPDFCIFINIEIHYVSQSVLTVCKEPNVSFFIILQLMILKFKLRLKLLIVFAAAKHELPCKRAIRLKGSL
jgi:hypothetical protein